MNRKKLKQIIREEVRNVLREDLTVQKKQRNTYSEPNVRRRMRLEDQAISSFKKATRLAGRMLNIGVENTHKSNDYFEVEMDDFIFYTLYRINEDEYSIVVSVPDGMYPEEAVYTEVVIRSVSGLQNDDREIAKILEEETENLL